MLIDLTLAQFAEQTAARSPTPGGGSVAAYVGALGAALGSMAACFTQGRKGFEAHEATLASEIARLQTLRVRLAALVDEDAKSYDKVTAAFGLPKATDAEKAARKTAIEAATKDAMQTPLGTCRLAVEALAVLDGLAGHVNPNLASDVAVGAGALGACYRGAWVNVLINLSGLKDETLRAKVLSEGETLGAQARQIEERVHGSIVRSLLG
jgi:glutamate formiminotransferase/formiminotetrahydrofolate cyclodeaminase